MSTYQIGRDPPAAGSVPAAAPRGSSLPIVPANAGFRDAAGDDQAQSVAAQLRAAAGWLLEAGGGGLVLRLYDALTTLASRIAGRDVAGATQALVAARRTLAPSCPITDWRHTRVTPAPLSADALDRAEAWLRRVDARSGVG